MQGRRFQVLSTPVNFKLHHCHGDIRVMIFKFFQVQTFRRFVCMCPRLRDGQGHISQTYGIIKVAAAAGLSVSQ
jgi:hypothetical protein